MDFLEFCSIVLKEKKLSDSRYSLALDNESSITGYFELIRQIFIKSDMNIGEIIHVQSGEIERLCAELVLTFLGEKKTYWLYDIQTLSALEQKKFLHFLQTNYSPHTLFLVLINKNIDYGIKIQTRADLTRNEAISITSMITGKDSQYLHIFFDALENKGVKISPEKLNLLISYSIVIGNRSPEFFKEWIPQIFTSQKSLFQLSQAFFSLDIKTFLNIWQNIYEQYSIAFWCIFFSEQLFKATLFVNAQKTKQLSNQDIEYRLPFSFLKKDWRLHSIEKLIRAHQSISDFDVQLKQGDIKEEYLEILCIQFMEQKNSIQ